MTFRNLERERLSIGGSESQTAALQRNISFSWLAYALLNVSSLCLSVSLSLSLSSPPLPTHLYTHIKSSSHSPFYLLFKFAVCMSSIMFVFITNQFLSVFQFLTKTNTYTNRHITTHKPTLRVVSATLTYSFFLGDQLLLLFLVHPFNCCFVLLLIFIHFLTHFWPRLQLNGRNFSKENKVNRNTSTKY